MMGWVLVVSSASRMPALDQTCRLVVQRLISGPALGSTAGTVARLIQARDRWVLNIITLSSLDRVKLPFAAMLSRSEK
jgi:hypothetical protein